MFYVTGFDELCEPRRCQVSWFTTQSVCDRRGLAAATSCGERRPFMTSSSFPKHFVSLIVRQASCGGTGGGQRETFAPGGICGGDF